MIVFFSKHSITKIENSEGSELAEVICSSWANIIMAKLKLLQVAEFWEKSDSNVTNRISTQFENL